MSQGEKVLKKHNLRITQFRVDVINVFNDARKALSSSEIETKLHDADRITLYRTLKSFEEKGIIHKAIDGTITQKFALCDAECDEHQHHDEHVHFHCEMCESTFCIEHVYVPGIDLPVGFKVKSKNLIVHGICQNCGK